MPKRKISELIKHAPVLCAPPHISVRDAACLMSEEEVGSLLIVENGELIGIFTERDALNRVLAEDCDPKTITLREVMTANPQTVGPEDQFEVALRMMSEGGFRHVPVVSGKGPVGVISARDALELKILQFEEAAAC